MKKSIYALLAVLTVFAMVMAGCDTDPKDEDKTVVTLNPTTLTVKVQESSRITATTVPADAELTWTSSNKDVALVNPIGTVTGVSVGTATITAAAADGGKATCAITVIESVSEGVTVEGDTLVHNPAKLAGGLSDFYGTDLGITNDDGTYSFVGATDFDGNAVAQYGGGAAKYDFPSPKANDTWTLSDYHYVEIFLENTGPEDIDLIIKKTHVNGDLIPVVGSNQYPTVSVGEISFKFLIEDAVGGIGFQRNRNGPATIKITKVEFTKAPMFTVSFSGGQAASLSIPSQQVPEGGKVTLPYKPKASGLTFAGWFEDAALTQAFNENTAINKDYTLTAKWTPGDPPVVDMKLALDFDVSKLPANAALTGGSPSYTIPAEYAETVYADGKLTITFDGRNRQRAIVPLTAEQIYELQDPELTGATFKIDATVARGAQGTLTNDEIAAGELGFAAFRLHLADPAAGSAWNGTDTGKQTPLSGNANADDDHLVEYRPFSSNKSAATLGYFVIQAMFKDNDGSPDSTKEGFPKVIITVNSITIEPGDTTE